MKRLDAEMTFPFQLSFRIAIPCNYSLSPLLPEYEFLGKCQHSCQLTALGSSSAGEQGAKLSARQTLKGINPLSIPGAHNAQTSKLVN